jgi:hypothetical protein
MPLKAFFKENFVLVVGLTLPVLLIVGFLVASNVPQVLSDPPQFDFVFSTIGYPAYSDNIPVSVRLVVRDGVLKAQYVRIPPGPGGYHMWRKLYVYDAKTRKVRELTFGFPPDMDSITGMREETVEATSALILDTTLQSPDGYELSFGGYSNGGLFNEMFWGGGNRREPRLRKGAASVRLATGDGSTYFSYDNVEFVGWATGRR